MQKNQEKKRILIIEDDLDVLSAFVKYFTHVGYEIIIATDGMEGLKKIEAGGYDLVITDIVMPFVSGVGVVTTLKDQKPDIPVIAITGFGKEPEAAAMEKKADFVLAKPVRISLLKEYVATLLNRTDDNVSG